MIMKFEALVMKWWSWSFSLWSLYESGVDYDVWFWSVEFEIPFELCIVDYCEFVILFW